MLRQSSVPAGSPGFSMAHWLCEASNEAVCDLKPVGRCDTHDCAHTSVHVGGSLVSTPLSAG